MKQALTLIIGLFTVVAAFANEFAPAISEHANTEVKKWLGDAQIVNAVKAQNIANAGLSEADIIKLDKTWRAETSASAQPMINKVLNNSLSAYLKQRQEASAGLYTEIFVMDNKGVNVGQSAITSDYWQGDEAKWQKTYQAGAGAIHISDVEEDESTQTFQSQLSLPVVDPVTGTVIGAVTIGVNVEGL